MASRNPSFTRRLLLVEDEQLTRSLVTFAEHPAQSADHDLIEWMPLADIDAAAWAPADRAALAALEAQA